MISVEEEAKQVVQRELGNASEAVLNKKLAPTAQNVLDEFTCCIEKMLATHFQNMRDICNSTQSREEELLIWLKRVSEMITALTEYKKDLDSKSLEFLEKAQEMFLEKVQRIIIPSYN
ncbi:MAG: hypothetical protein M1495_18665 [Bacteroidetes bacterium]|nr:hypothetical protein [Bacteroidota bacterium]